MKNEQEKIKLASYWSHKFKEALVAKEPYTRRWMQYLDAYKGEYFKNTNLPEYRSNAVSNYIYSVIETIRPIMFDNDPKFVVMPRNNSGMEYANVLQEALTYEFDREKMNTKLYRELINTLTLGTAVFFLPYNKFDEEVNAVAVNPFNLFPDPLATCVEDAEYLIYATYKNIVQLREEFPDTIEGIVGGNVKYEELINNQRLNQNVDNQVLILEIWTKDFELYEEQNNNEKKMKRKYPNGRIITIAPDFNVVLEDKENPYQDNNNRFPFFLIKDYDVPGQFWGEGEVQQLLSPQQSMNDLTNAIIDNAKATANMPWIVDRNAGIPQGAITARPGLIIRKNPGSTVQQQQPPQMPPYVREAIEVCKSDIEQISGAHSTLRGDNATGVYTAQGIIALQEAGQTRIRLKVKILEEALGEIATSWVHRMRQFWKDKRWIAITDSNGKTDARVINQDVLSYDYNVRISAGSTMPINRGAMLDLMLRLAQTPMPDGQPLVDREAVVKYLPPEIRSALMQRMEERNVQLEELQQGVQQMAEELGQKLMELEQQLQAIIKESQTNDNQTFEVIEEITNAIDDVKQQILQLEDEYAKLEEENNLKEKEEKIREQAYNKGYREAEQSLTQSVPTDFESVASAPDDVLSDLELMSDEELAELYENNPDALDKLLNS